MMDTSKIISARENMEGITFHLIGEVVDGKSSIQIVTYAYDDPDFALAVRALEDFASRDDHV